MPYSDMIQTTFAGPGQKPGPTWHRGCRPKNMIHIMGSHPYGCRLVKRLKVASVLFSFLSSLYSCWPVTAPHGPLSTSS
eukprot:1149248-Pelagomonas_calceolata.AAC.3